MNSVGIVETKAFTYPGPLRLESGEELGPITVAYETYGSLNADKSNAVLIFHALSGDAHVAGFNSPDEKKPGWWDSMVGSGKAFDTDKYFVICANVLGGCRGSTGPASINPKTGKAYGLEFPAITLTDMVNAQVPLFDSLGINKFVTCVGGSMGGMLCLAFAAAYPERVASVIAVASTPRLSAQNIAFNEVGRRAILADPHFQNGDYYGKTPPADGLAIARMIGHITYLSDESMHQKFGRQAKGEQQFQTKFGADFEVQSYLRYKGQAFTERFDANSYLYITKAIDYFDLAAKKGSLQKAFEGYAGRFLVLSFSSDWLFPKYQSLELVDALRDINANVSYREIDSSYGHDAFLLEIDELSLVIRNFLRHV